MRGLRLSRFEIGERSLLNICETNDSKVLRSIFQGSSLFLRFANQARIKYLSDF